MALIEGQWCGGARQQRRGMNQGLNVGQARFCAQSGVILHTHTPTHHAHPDRHTHHAHTNQCVREMPGAIGTFFSIGRTGGLEV
jgi:hypothetical protein